MNQAPWRQMPPPDLGAAGAVLGQWSPVVVAEITAGRLQLGAALHDGSRPAHADEASIHRLILAFEELVSNALRHGRSPVTVSVTAADRSWLLKVRDAGGDRPPAVAVGRDPGQGGLGLGLVASLSDEHGWYRDADGGKTVWARLAFDEPKSVLFPET